MKKTIKLIEAMRGIAIIVLIMMAVIPAFAGGSRDKADKPDPSTLIITGLEKWNGMRVQADSDNGDTESIYAAARVIKGEDYDPMAGAKGVGVVIANGTAALNVWNLKIGDMDWDKGSADITATPYTGNDTIEFDVEIWNGGETFHTHSFVARGTVKAKFSGGAARAAFVFVYERDPDMWD